MPSLSVSNAGKLFAKGLVFIALIASASCQTIKDENSKPRIMASAKYVAMGSSFAAGPGVGQKDSKAHPNCGQSTSNYPKLLAARLGLKLTDVTCGGATSDNVLKIAQHIGLLPQIENITPDTALVTLTIGGNDLKLARDLAITSCNNIRIRHNDNNFHCNSKPLPPPEEAFQVLASNLDKIAKEAKRRAPNARIIFLDYQAILPETGNCEKVYLSDEELADLRARQFRYAQIVKRAASQNNIEFFSAYEATRGHDACSDLPFMAGAISIGTGAWTVPNFHTTQEGMTAIANGLEKHLIER